jgi:hypothetical protein
MFSLKMLYKSGNITAGSFAFVAMTKIRICNIVMNCNIVMKESGGIMSRINPAIAQMKISYKCPTISYKFLNIMPDMPDIPEYLIYLKKEGRRRATDPPSPLRLIHIHLLSNT